MKPRGLTVARLIERLSTLPPDALCVVPACDHSYNSIGFASPCLADWDRGQLYECWPEDGYPAQGEPIQVVVIGI